ncbi:hypothetical protein Fcan01_16113 [Folsomia candida]|uniref:Uncharacterized protein n=1 Tax=Folsomia candida TaxID=158441 RepID=A0A226DUU1_FOLCA|nr:hypothetical protein Fcan01_16113 [Folsomia candida]
MSHIFKSKRSRWSMKRKLHDFLNPLTPDPPDKVENHYHSNDANIDDFVFDCSSLCGDENEQTEPLQNWNLHESSISDCSDRCNVFLSDNDSSDEELMSEELSISI